MKKNVQEEIRENITNSIINALEQGVSPWRKPWTGGGLPINYVSKKAYRGINVALLAIHQMQYNLCSNVYGTFNQWKEAGCMVKKGSKGSPIVFYTQVKTTKELANGDKKDTTFPLLRTFTVFNSDQVEGADKLIVKEQPKNPVELHSEADRIIKAYLEDQDLIVKTGDKAAYYSSLDVVMMPPIENFVLGTNSYYGTMFHELVHSTGAENRLNRLDKLARFGNASYAMEELVAEIGGCYLLGAVGLPVLNQLENHTSYLANWLDVLKKDKKAIFQASAAASAASDFILKPSAIEIEEEELVAV